MQQSASTKKDWMSIVLVKINVRWHCLLKQSHQLQRLPVFQERLREPKIQGNEIETDTHTNDMSRTIFNIIMNATVMPCHGTVCSSCKMSASSTWWDNISAWDNVTQLFKKWMKRSKSAAQSSRMPDKTKTGEPTQHPWWKLSWHLSFSIFNINGTFHTK